MVNSTKIGKKGDDQYYQLLFNIRVKAADKRLATLKVLVVSNANTISLYGIRINAAQQLD